MQSTNIRHIAPKMMRRFMLKGRLMRKSTASELQPARITHSVEMTSWLSGSMAVRA